MVYVIQVCRQLSSRTRVELMSMTYRVSCQNKFLKLVHLLDFITKKFVTIFGRMNVKKKKNFFMFICTSVPPSARVDQLDPHWRDFSRNLKFECFAEIC
jgi:hypothetical protein